MSFIKRWTPCLVARSHGSWPTGLPEAKDAGRWAICLLNTTSPPTTAQDDLAPPQGKGRTRTTTALGHVRAHGRDGGGDGVGFAGWRDAHVLPAPHNDTNNN